MRRPICPPCPTSRHHASLILHDLVSVFYLLPSSSSPSPSNPHTPTHPPTSPNRLPQAGGCIPSQSRLISSASTRHWQAGRQTTQGPAHIIHPSRDYPPPSPRLHPSPTTTTTPSFSKCITGECQKKRQGERLVVFSLVLNAPQNTFNVPCVYIFFSFPSQISRGDT